MTSKPQKSLWTECERDLLDGILDQLIPANTARSIPSAGALGVAEFLAARISAAPGLAELFQHGLATAMALSSLEGSSFSALNSDNKIAVLKKLENHEPVFFEALLRHTYMGYYSNSSVRALLGLSANPPQPGGYDVPPDDPAELAALVAPVKDRGTCFKSI